MQKQYHKWHSWRLDREVELLVIGHAGAKVLVFPTRDGNFQEYERLRMPESLQQKIDGGELQLFCVDYLAGETFYCWWAHPAGRLHRHWQFEEYVLHEVFPLMEMINNSERVIAHGCSLGAFLAANLAFRHPHLFQKLVTFSGRYDLTLSVGCFTNLLDGYYDENVYFHMPTHFLPNVQCSTLLSHLRRMEIVLVIGKHDPFKANNEALSHILHQKKVPHTLHYWEERAHSGYYWRRMAPIYL
jgi:esterase/lipase superfamily enzyme